MSLLGYARVSTVDQDAALQLAALEVAGCDRVWTETASGAHQDRPQLAELLAYAREGDVVVVWRLDRLGRSLRHLLDLAEQLQQRGVGLRSVTEQLDTTTPGGRLIFAVLGALAEFERELIRERTRAGMAAVRAAGREVGRPPVMTGGKLAAARVLLEQGQTVAYAAAAVGVSRRTLSRSLAALSS